MSVEISYTRNDYVDMNILPCMRQWVERNLAPPQPKARLLPVPKVKPVVAWTEVSDLDRRLLAALRQPTYPVASPDKRFAQQIQGVDKMTERQRAYAWRLAYRYRRQIGDKGIVEEAKARQVKS